MNDHNIIASPDRATFVAFVPTEDPNRHPPMEKSDLVA